MDFERREADMTLILLLLTMGGWLSFVFWHLVYLV